MPHPPNQTELESDLPSPSLPAWSSPSPWAGVSGRKVLWLGRRGLGCSGDLVPKGLNLVHRTQKSLPLCDRTQARPCLLRGARPARTPLVRPAEATGKGSLQLSAGKASPAQHPCPCVLQPPVTSLTNEETWKQANNPMSIKGMFVRKVMASKCNESPQQLYTHDEEVQVVWAKVVTTY